MGWGRMGRVLSRAGGLDGMRWNRMGGVVFGWIVVGWWRTACKECGFVTVLYCKESSCFPFCGYCNEGGVSEGMFVFDHMHVQVRYGI